MNQRTRTTASMLAFTASFIAACTIALSACGHSAEAPTPPATVVVTVRDSTPATLAAVSDTTFTGVVGAQLPASPGVVVRTKDGSLLANIPVAFDVTGGGGSVGSAVVSTTADGSARTTWTLGRTPGAQSIRASAAGLPAVTFRATGTAAPASKLAKVLGDAQTITVGAAVQPLVVKVTDAFDNAVSGASLTATVKSGQGTLASTSVTTDTSGKATLTGWTAGTHPGANVVEIGGTGLSAVTFTATAVAGPAETIAFTTTDTIVVARGDSLSMPLLAADHFGNVVPSTTAVLRVADASVAATSGVQVKGVAIGLTTLTATIGSSSVSLPLLIVGHPTGSTVSARFSSANQYVDLSTANGVLFATTYSPFGLVRLDASGVPTASFLSIPSGPALLRPTPDARRIVFVPVNSPTTVASIDLTTGIQTSAGVPDQPTALAVSGDGQHVYAGLFAALADLSLPLTGTSRRIGIHSGFIQSIAFGPGDSLIYTNDVTGSTLEIDRKSFTVKRPWIMALTYTMAVSRDGAYLYGGEPGGQFDVMRLSDTSVVRRVTTPSRAQLMAIAPDGKELYVALYNPNVLLVYRLTDPSNPVLDRSIPLVSAPGAIAVDRRGAFVAVLSYTNLPTIEIIR